MNAVRNAGCTIIALLLLAGCASTPEQSAVAASKAPATKDVLDMAYINKVERAARQDNVDVRWVNPPTKRETAATSDTSDTSSSTPR
jgi:uncharacterized lipoprotein YajG